MKKSFILYVDQGEIIDSLTDFQAGKLIKAIFDFQKGNNPELPPAIRSVFISFKQTLARDNEKWENIRERNIENGKLGGRPKLNKTQKNPKNPNGYFGNPKNLVSVNVNDNVNVKKDNKTTKTPFSSYKENQDTNSNTKTNNGSNKKIVSSTHAGLDLETKRKIVAELNKMK